MTTMEMTVDGDDAFVILDAHGEQLVMIEAEDDDVLRSLARKADALGEQEERNERGKQRAKALKAEVDALVRELARRGKKSAQMLLPMNGAVKPNPTGEYERIPSEDSPEHCVCGAVRNVDDATHDPIHATFVKALGPELAPSTLAKHAQPAEAPAIGGPDAPPSICKTCAAPIAFALSPNLKNVPVDLAPSEDGEYVVAGRVNDEKGVLRIQLGKTQDHPGATERYASHFKRCLQAASHSRKRSGNAS